MAEGAGRSVEILEPVVQYQDADTPQIPVVPRPARLEGKRIAFVANSKPQSVPFMEALVASAPRDLQLEKAFNLQIAWDLADEDCVRRSASEIGALKKECDLLVTGVGD